MMCRIPSQRPGDEDLSGTCAAWADRAAMLFIIRECPDATFPGQQFVPE